MKTHEIEQMLGITKQALIYYEKEGLINPVRDENNYRNYSSSDIDILRLILLLRSMGVSIDEIKLILSEKLSIRKALETKKDYLNKEKSELELIEQNINKYIQRKKVSIVFNNEVVDNYYIHLNVSKDKLSFLDINIFKEEITGIDVSLCCSKGEIGMYYRIYNLYFVDLDIHTRKDSYSFELMTNSKVNDLFNWLLECRIIVNDPMNIIDIYKTYQDPIKLNKYINQHFREWAKVYHLDNPRDNFYTVIKNDYIKPLEEFKKEEVPTVRGQFKELFQYFVDSLKRNKK